MTTNKNMSKKSAVKLPKLPGHQVEINGQKMRVLEGAFGPKGGDYGLMHEIEGVCAWIGRTHEEKGFVLDAFPVFTFREYAKPASATTIGMVLLADLARDFTTENRIASGNFTVGNVDDLQGHIYHTYGATTLEYMTRTFLGRRLGQDNARFLAKRLGRILRLNYPAVSSQIKVDGHRLLVEGPFKKLTALEGGCRIESFQALATYLGTVWLEAEASLLARNPDLYDRSEFFSVTNEAA